MITKNKWIFIIVVAFLFSLIVTYNVVGFVIYKNERNYYKEVSSLYCQISNKQKSLLNLSNISLPSNLLEEDKCDDLGYKRPLEWVFPK